MAMEHGEEVGVMSSPARFTMSYGAIQQDVVYLWYFKVWGSITTCSIFVAL